MTRWRTRHRGSHAERGAAAVEFAIVLVVLLLIIFAIIDFGRLLFVSQSMKAASREAARTASIRDTTWGTITTAGTNAGASAAALAGGTLSLTNSRNITDATYRLCTQAANSNPTGSNSQATGSPITVTATTGFRWFTPVGIFSSNVNSVSADTTMRCE